MQHPHGPHKSQGCLCDSKAVALCFDAPLQSHLQDIVLADDIQAELLLGYKHLQCRLINRHTHSD